ncbi:hypothetical protein DFH07DRAFT_814257 [Mycena maculata]|uniref:HNH nuclease domain-containing protein n=1 Tax=Mycena maculata TaxID=230809 RepID=A0AAD7JFT0_9AGAR|nr:hypothetical protein DFH07DRAFT_814257 [Mycena maculata]
MHRCSRSTPMVVCRWTIDLEHAHIVPKGEDSTWADLKSLGFIPTNAKSLSHEACNSVLFYPNHHRAFETFISVGIQRELHLR